MLGEEKSKRDVHTEITEERTQRAQRHRRRWQGDGRIRVGSYGSGRKSGGKPPHSKGVKIFSWVMKISLDKMVKYGRLCSVEKCETPRTGSGGFCFWGGREQKQSMGRDLSCAAIPPLRAANCAALRSG